ncbi:hypothetical protein EHQ27_06265, partial [Leptospira wolffii]
MNLKNFEDLCNEAISREDISEDYKPRIKIATAIFERLLGNELWNMRDFMDHYLYQYIMNTAPWTRNWLVWFADALRDIEGSNNFNKTLNSFKRSSLSREKFQILRNAYRFKQAGFEIAFEPPLLINNKSAESDIEIVNKKTTDTLLVEITEVNESDQSKEAWDSFSSMIDYLSRNYIGYQYSGELRRVVSDNTMEEIFRRIDNAVEKVNSDNLFQIIDIENLIKLAIGKYDDPYLPNWCEKNGYQINAFSGPGVTVDETHRTK